MGNAQVEAILDRVNIVDVIGKYIPLKRTGSNFKARCPFHDEKTASFVVSEKKQIYKCFGCGVGGNAITFVKEYEKISYGDAIRKLAAEAGIILQSTPKAKKENSFRELLYKSYHDANEFFRTNIKQHGSFALKYLKERKVSSETIKKFQIGYALDGFTSLFNYLQRKGIDPKILAKSGLFTTTKNGLIDTFRDRLMFPIHTATGKVVAFGGRILREKKNTGKYINSPTTDIYTKGDELYGLNITRFEISKKDHVLISEGYMDFLRLYEFGFTNSVASLGTSLTQKQIKLLGRYTSNFVLLYDGDKAGIKAAVRAAGEIIKNGYDPKIIKLPHEHDPDSFLLENEADKLKNYINEAQDLIHYIKKEETLELSGKDKINLLLEIVNGMDDQINREFFIKDIAEIFSLQEKTLTSGIKPKRKRTNSPSKNSDFQLERYIEEKNLLNILLNDISSHKKVAQEIVSDYFLSDGYKSVFEGILYQINGDMTESKIIELFSDEESRKIVTDILMSEKKELPLDETIRVIKLRKLKHDFKKVKEELLKSKNDIDLLAKKSDLLKLIRSLEKKVVNQIQY